MADEQNDPIVKETLKDGDKKKRPIDRNSDARCKLIKLIQAIWLFIDIVSLSFLSFILYF